MIRVHVRRRSGEPRDRELNRILARVMLNLLRQTTPVRTGKLRRGWRITEVNGQSFTLENDVFYGVYVDQGTATISPRRFTKKAADEWFRMLAGNIYATEYRRAEITY